MGFGSWSASAVGRAMRACLLVALAAASLGAPSVALARPAFEPEYVLSDAKLRDTDSMTLAQVQTFLDGQSGALKSLRTPDHTGSVVAASKIIYDACQAWGISPKVMLALLQKENSLITNPNPTQRALSRAVGAGCPNSTDNRYPGFGPQVWNGARMLDGYGEGKTTSYIPLWSAGRTCTVAEGTVTPHNVATFKLYTYNPVIGAERPYGDLTAQSGSLHGNASFWNIYWRWFGDPLGGTSSSSGSTGASSASPSVSTWQPATPTAGMTAVQALKLLERRGKLHTADAGPEAPVYRFYVVPSRSYVYLDSKNIRDWLLFSVDPTKVRPAGVSLRATR